MRLLTTLICIIWSYALYAQWQGDTAKYLLFTDSLQLNDSAAGSTYLSHPSDIVDSATWQFKVHMKFNPSSSNYVCVYLKSEQADLNGNAYYLKIGGTDDNIALYRQDANNQSNKLLIEGLYDRLDISDVYIQIKVNYLHGMWRVFSRFETEEYFEEGSAIDSTNYLSSYFGVRANYTKTRSKLIAFSDFMWSGISYKDTDPPRLDSLHVLTQNTVKFYFNEVVDTATFSCQNEEGFIVESDSNVLVVQFENDFPERDTFTINYDVSDRNNNAIKNTANANYIPFELVFARMLCADSLMFKLNKRPKHLEPVNIRVNQQNPLSIEAYDGAYIATFGHAFPERTSLLLNISHVVDINGDTLHNNTREFSFIIPQFQDLIFTEIMADPSPTIGTLPEVEFIEIFNTTAFEISLDNWVLKREDKSYPLPNYSIKPFSFAILGSFSATEALAKMYSNTLPLEAFPALNNTEMELSLISNTSTLIDYIHYSHNWHIDAFHRAGGFSLERIDFSNLSMANNWTSSCAQEGATPGMSNCVEAYNPDFNPPHIAFAYAINHNEILVELKELIYKPQLEFPTCYQINHSMKIERIEPLGETAFTSQFVLHLVDSLIDFEVYELVISGLSDLSGNVMSDTLIPIALCAKADSADILFSEIMFDPQTDGVEYIELYNASAFPIDLSDYVLSKPDTLGTWSYAYALSQQPLLFMPDTYWVLTKDKAAFLKQYPSLSSVVEMPNLPSLNNTEGAWGILSKTAQVIDQMSYSEDCHSPFLDNTKGVALERVSFSTSALIHKNWQSASALAFYATPACANSHQEELLDFESLTSISPQSFTPDGDGIDDRVAISIHSKYAGSSIKVCIYNHRGVLVKQLLENDLIASFPVIYWDGSNETQQRCSVGPYVVFIEIITAENRVLYDRKEIVLSAKAL